MDSRGREGALSVVRMRETESRYRHKLFARRGNLVIQTFQNGFQTSRQYRLSPFIPTEFEWLSSLDPDLTSISRSPSASKLLLPRGFSSTRELTRSIYAAGRGTDNPVQQTRHTLWRPEEDLRRLKVSGIDMCGEWMSARGALSLCMCERRGG